jgi:hypothetical protein
MLGKGHEHEPLGPDLHLPVRDNVSIFLPPPRRAPNRVAWQRARHYRGPTWSCAESAMALVGRAVALAPDDRGRREALREDARVLAALVREREVSKADAVDRILNAGIAFGVPDTEIDEILFSEFSA